MAVFVALLRAINVGGTGKLPMAELRELCAEQGFEGAETYIQSGNVVFKSDLAEPKVKAKLERALVKKMGKPVAVLLRRESELAAVLKGNPFQRAEPSRVLVLFLDVAPAKNALEDLVIPGREQVKLRGRELFIYFPDGMGHSKLKVPFAKIATGRNINTVAKLLALAQGFDCASFDASRFRSLV